jgi:glutamyl-tRNA synthetase
VEFDDEFKGPQSIDPSASVGDFVVWTRRGQPSYQLAVVVDDARQGVTHVVRGDDLLDSAARQLVLYRALSEPHAEAWGPVAPATGSADLSEPHTKSWGPVAPATGSAEPSYLHLPLVRGSDGKRLAKRHGDTRLDSYRAAGVPAERIVGLVASWCGLGPPRPMTAAEFAAGLRLDKVPPHDIVFTREHHAWLGGRE